MSVLSGGTFDTSQIREELGHLGGIWEASTLGFPPLPDTWTRKDIKAQVSWISDILHRFATFLLTFHGTLQWKPTDSSMIHVFRRFWSILANQRVLCDTSGTADGHFYRFGTHILHLMLTPFVGAAKITRSSNGVGIQSGNLRHIPDKGGTGRHPP